MRQKEQIQNPWAGLSSYEDPARSSRKLKFCGRDSDTFDVTRLIDDNFFVTLYGKSGIGKTSLLNAGVFPALRREQYTPLSLRLGMTDESQGFQDIITTNIERAVEEAGGSVRVVPVVEEQPDRTAIDYLWNWFARRQFLTAEGQTTFPVVVFDQFEEVFRQSDSRVKTEVLLAQLHYLIDESHAIGDCIVDGEEYTYDFNFRFVLSIREDDLYRLEDSLDNGALTALKRCRYRLRSLSEQGARAAILLPGEGLFRPEEQDGIVQTIIGIARNKEDQSISTNLLSLVCNRIFVEFQKRPEADFISQSLVDTFVKGNPFERFYDEATKGFSNREKSYIEEHLVDSTGRRNSVPESDFLLHVPNGAKLLEGDTRILQRSSVSTDGGNYRIELIHDSFCEPLSRQREKREKRKRVRMFIAAVGVALLCLGITAFILYQINRIHSQEGTIAQQDEDLKLKNEQLEKEKNAAQLKAQQLAEALEQIDEKNTALEREKEIALSRAKQLAVALGQIDEKNTALQEEKELALLRAQQLTEAFDQIDEKNQELEQTMWSMMESRARVVAAKGQELIGNYDSYTARLLALAILPDSLENPDKPFVEDAIVLLRDAVLHNNGVLSGHEQSVNSVAFSPEGKRIVSGSDDGTMRIWDAETGGQICQPLKGHTDCVKSVAFSPDGKRIVSGADDNTVRIWDVGTGKQIGQPLEGHTEHISSVSFSPDGKRIVSGSEDSTIRIWDVETGHQIGQPIEGHTMHVTSVAFSPDGKRIVSASDDKTVRIWDTETGMQIGKPLVGHKDGVTSVAFSPDGKQIVSASADKTVRIWDLEQKIILKNADGHNIRTRTVNYNPDGTLVASYGQDIESDKDFFYLWNPKTGKIVRVLGVCHDYLKFAAFSRDGKLVAYPSEDKTIHVCNVKTGETISTFGGQIDAWYLFTIDFSPDGKRIVSASSDDIRVWDVKTGKELFVINQDNQHIFKSAVFSPDGKLIVSASSHRLVDVWDAYTGKRKYGLYGHDKGVNSAFFSPDGKLIVSASDDNTIRIWDTKSEFELKRLEGHTKEVLFATFSPDGKYIVSASRDNSVRVWDVETGKQVQIYDFKTEDAFNASIFFSPDGRQILFAATNFDVRIWDFPPLQELIDQTRKRFKDRQLTPEERKKYYLE